MECSGGKGFSKYWRICQKQIQDLKRENINLPNGFIVITAPTAFALLMRKSWRLEGRWAEEGTEDAAAEELRTHW